MILKSRYILFAAVVFFLTSYGLWAEGSGESDTANPSSGNPNAADPPHEPTKTKAPVSEPSRQPSADVSNPLVILSALAQAYPDKVKHVAIRNGDWSVLINGEPFYWGGGRMLPEADRSRQEEFSTYAFRPYSSDAPEIPDLSPEQEERLKSRINRREAGLDGRHPAFLNALWPGMGEFLEAEDTVIHQHFLGWKIRIHPYLSEPLARVEEDILTAAENDEETAAWIDSLGAVGGYVWRDIAGSANRSLHSFGIAIDVQPRSYGGTQAYWRWAADFYDEWWSLPVEDRYRIPPSVVAAFENRGFTWGGKWFLYDQIHFEYRPELFILGELAGTWP